MKPPVIRRLLAALVALVVLAGACSDGGADRADRDRDRDEAPDRDADDDTDDDTADDEQTPGIDLEGIPVEDQDDAIIEAALAEVEAFWEDRFADTFGGRRFSTVEGGFVAYGPDRPLPRCGGPLTYDEIAQNAFYCPGDDVIAWDTDNLTNQLLEEFGAFSLAIVMAHEYGHAVQSRVPVTGPTIALEQQADCFAGAFTAFVEAGDSDVLSVSLDDLDSAVAGFLTLRDAPGTPANDPSAHGSAFDRVGAFQDGFLNGPDRCAEYEEIYDRGGSTVIDVRFTAEDAATGGNAPFDPAETGDIFELTLGSLETFWSEALPARFDGLEWFPLAPDGRVVPFDPDRASSLPDCPDDDIDPDAVAGTAFTCFGSEEPGDEIIAFDVNLAADQYERIGDFAVSGLLSQQYAFVAQSLLGTLGDGRANRLQADCFSGAWVGEVTLATLRDGGQTFPEEFGGATGVRISAGDLDEVVQSFLLLGAGASAEDNVSSPFERVAAFRDGFLEGLPSCARYV